MSKPVGFVHVVVVVLPITRSRVVRRVDVDYVHLAFVAVQQQLERMVIVRVDENVPRLARRTFDGIHGDQSRVHRLAERFGHDHAFSRNDFFRSTSFRHDFDFLAVDCRNDAVRLGAVFIPLEHARSRSRWQAGQPQQFREMFFKYKPEFLGRLEPGNFRCELFPQARIGDLLDEVFDCGHVMFKKRGAPNPAPLTRPLLQGAQEQHKADAPLRGRGGRSKRCLF